ncbi:hypothetical protein [Paraflavitalea speifideaquila]|uniref:hypothetical protein n=1 Tax=Paraflavitalea speifideaquila TaxID=3076558 RepID=UPI0028E3E700|nr:hypothetical protein [Paraflavitalea speifideiaquila]
MPAFYNKMTALIIKHLTGNLSEDEKMALEQEINSSAYKKQLFAELTNPGQLSVRLNRRNQVDLDYHWHRIQQVLAKRKKVIRLRNSCIAAAIIFLAGLATWHLLPLTKSTLVSRVAVHVQQPTPTLPAINENYLELSDGQRISLDSLTNGKTLYDGKTRIHKTQDCLEYKPAPPGDSSVSFNRIVVPREKNTRYYYPMAAIYGSTQPATYAFLLLLMHPKEW